MEYQIDIVNQILIFAMFALSLNLLLGYAGQGSIAHAAFGAVGGYAAGYLSAKSGLGFAPSVLIAVVTSLIAGTLASLPALRLGEEYLILLTFAFSTIVISIVIAWSKLGGAYGLLGIQQMNLFGHDLPDPSDKFPLLLVLFLIVFAFCWRLGESPFGRLLKAIREDELATRSLGKNVYAYKVIVFGVTSAIAGLAGALFVYYNQLASPQEFSVNVSISIIAMVVFGGSANLFGSVLGAALIVVSGPVLEKWVSLGEEKAALWRLLLYGAALVVLMVLRPQGIIPERSSLRGWLSPLFRRRAPTPALVPELSAAMAGAGAPAPTATSAAPENAPAFVGAAQLGAVTSGLRQDVAQDRLVQQREIGVATLPSTATVREPVLVVRGLRKSFGGITAVDGVDLDLPAGEVTGLIGPNGAGKSTLFGLFTGFLRPDAGTVLLRGTDVRGKSPDAVAGLGMVRSFQDVRMFQGLTVLENVMLAEPRQPGENLGGLFLRPASVSSSERRVREHALEYLAFVGLVEKADWLTAGLAYAEQKLAAIARVLATGAEVLLLDEPTSGVDPRWVDSVAAVIRGLPALGKTVCIVEHNLAFLEKIGAPCYFMEAGKITAKATVGELMTDERLRKAYFGV